MLNLNRIKPRAPRDFGRIYARALARFPDLVAEGVNGQKHAGVVVAP